MRPVKKNWEGSSHLERNNTPAEEVCLLGSDNAAEDTDFEAHSLAGDSFFPDDDSHSETTVAPPTDAADNDIEEGSDDELDEEDSDEKVDEEESGEEMNEERLDAIFQTLLAVSANHSKSLQ